MSRWAVILLPEVEAWLMTIAVEQPRLAERVVAAIDLLEAEGPHLGRPLVDRIAGSRLPHLKELRVATVRALFAFDPDRRAIVLAIGDKRGRWTDWYSQNIQIAERRFEQWVATRGQEH
ncbi:type II toxin-antitoxin system RelE/ParE family toxin [Demequina silvatica]|uniref:type II toxin-antitoxin system RelE/ParE family toxin n=1 Tax=Demequina silvatica TaxID=1638988 RepID=UPI0007815896|nr:type II toxin-antitoxin system RelE/ParE family toxin [Demequina silvatica]